MNSSVIICSSVAQSCPIICYPTDSSMPGFPVLHHLLELAQREHNNKEMMSGHLEFKIINKIVEQKRVRFQDLGQSKVLLL